MIPDEINNTIPSHSDNFDQMKGGEKEVLAIRFGLKNLQGDHSENQEEILPNAVITLLKEEGINNKEAQELFYTWLDQEENKIKISEDGAHFEIIKGKIYTFSGYQNEGDISFNQGFLVLESNFSHIHNSEEKKESIKNYHSILEEIKNVRLSANPNLEEASAILRRKGVQVFFSAENEKGNNGLESYVTVNYTQLSQENKEILTELGEEKVERDERIKMEGDVVIYKIPFDINEGDRLEVKAKKVVESFKNQKPDWIKTFTIEDLKKKFSIRVSNEEFDNQNYWAQYYFYDQEKKIFYKSKEEYELAQV